MVWSTKYHASQLLEISEELRQMPWITQIASKRLLDLSAQLSWLAGDNRAQESLLLRLPSELRNRIYELVCVEHGPIYVGDWARPPDGAVEPSLLRVCHQIRSEALSVFYGKNMFEANNSDEDRTSWKEWLVRLTREKVKMVRHIRVGPDVTVFGFFARKQHEASLNLEAARRWAKTKRVGVREDALFVEMVDIGSYGKHPWTNDLEVAKRKEWPA